MEKKTNDNMSVSNKSDENILIELDANLSLHEIYDMLHIAVSNENLIFAKGIVKAMTLHIPTSWCEGYELLMEAISSKHFKTAKFLLEHWKNINFTPEKSTKLLHSVLVTEDTDLLELLLCKFDPQSLNINARDENGETPLLKAVKTKNDKITNIVLCYKPDLDDERNRLSLIYAVRNFRLPFTFRGIDKTEQEAIVTSLLNYGYNFNVDEAKDKKLLGDVAEYGHLRALKNLLKLGANPNEIVKYNDCTMFQLAMQQEDEEMTNVLLEYGADINYKNSSGWTYLMDTIFAGKQYDMVNYLLKKGIEVNVEDDSGKTAIDFAAESEDPNVLERLLKYNVDPNYINKHGKTPLYKAVKRGAYEVVATLANNGANINAKLFNGLTPLQFAIERQHPRVALYLLYNGADPDIQDDLGRTALHIAMSKGNRGLVYALLNYDPDITIQDNKGRFAIECFSKEYDPFQTNNIRKEEAQFKFNTIIYLFNQDKFDEDPYNGKAELEIFSRKEEFYSDYIFILSREDKKQYRRVGLPIPQMYKEYEFFRQQRLKVITKEFQKAYKTYSRSTYSSYERYVIQVRKMWKDFIWKEITCFDIFTLSDYNLSKLIQNEEFAQKLKAFNFKKYKYYKHMFKWRIRDIEEFKNLRLLAANFLQRVFSFKLAFDVTLEIANNLQSKDIRALLRI